MSDKISCPDLLVYCLKVSERIRVAAGRLGLEIMYPLDLAGTPTVVKQNRKAVQH